MLNTKSALLKKIIFFWWSLPFIFVMRILKQTIYQRPNYTRELNGTEFMCNRFYLYAFLERNLP